MALILVAAQDSQVSQSIERTLARLNYKIVTTPTVQKAIVWLEEAISIPDLIIADVGLKVFGGLEFIQKLRASEKCREIPILVQTKSQKCEIFEFCQGALMKPYSSQELIQAVTMILGIPSAIPESLSL